METKYNLLFNNNKKKNMLTFRAPTTLKSEGEVTSLSGTDKREVRDNRKKWWYWLIMSTRTDVTFQFTLFIFFRNKDSKSSQEKGKFILRSMIVTLLVLYIYANRMSELIIYS
jgi:hypothetical protein